MRINTFIVILLITFIICNNNNHIKGQENNELRKLSDVCIDAFKPLDGTYKTLTPPSTETETTQFIKEYKIVYVTSANVYTFYTSKEKTQEKNTRVTKIFTIQEELTFKLDAANTLSGNINYLFPWTKTKRPTSKETADIASTASGYSADCATRMNNDNQLKAANIDKLPAYEKIDQYTETLDEIRNAVDAVAIGEGVMLSRVDTAAPLRNYNIFLSKTQFCHFSCKIDNTECNLLVYETADYKSEVINLATIIGFTGKAKYYKTVKADTATAAVVDACVAASADNDECTEPLYTVISKGTGKILTGYYMDEKTKYSVSTSTSPKMPAGIQAKFPTFEFCFKEPEVQGVSNMFINSILLILIVILMI